MTALQSVLPTLLNMSAQGGVIILAVAALRLLLRRAPKAYSYALWSAVLLRLLCPFSFESAVGLLSLLNRAGADTEPVPQSFGSVPVFPATQAGSAAAAVPDSLPADVAGNAAATVTQPTVQTLDWGQLLAAMWLVGAAALALYGVWSLVRLVRRLHAAAPQPEQSGRLRVYRVAGLETAFVVGGVRPRVYLPAGLDADQERYILAHETAHLRRGDPLWRLLAYAALCLHWFNPLVWLAFRLSERDMEMSCDEAVVRRYGPGIKKGYSASLLALATGRRITLAAPLAFGEGDTAPRIKNVLRYKKPAFWMAAAIAVLVGALCLFLAADPVSGGSTGMNQRYTFADETAKPYTVIFELPQGLSFVEQPVQPDELLLDPPEPVTIDGDSYYPVVEGAESKIGDVLRGGEDIGEVVVGVFTPPDAAEQPARDEPSWHMMAYHSFMLGSLTDWSSDYAVAYQTQTTEAALTNVYVNEGEAGAMAAGPMVLRANAVLYMDTNTGAYVKFVLEPDATREDERLALAHSIRFGEGGTATEVTDGADAAGAALPARSVADWYEGGGMFAPLDEDALTGRLNEVIAAGLVPDARKGGRIATLDEWADSDAAGPVVVQIAAWPEQELYLYGYRDETFGAAGMILDVGAQQTLYGFPYRYSWRGDVSAALSADGGLLFVESVNGTGTGVSVSELFVFRLDGGTVQGFAVPNEAVVDALNQQATLYWNGTDHSLTAVRTADGEPLLQGNLQVIGAQGQPEPTGWFAGQILGYALGPNGVYACTDPVFAVEGGQGFFTGDGTLLCLPLYFTADGDGALRELGFGGVQALSAAEQDQAFYELNRGANRLPGMAEVLSDAKAGYAAWYADLNGDGVDETLWLGEALVSDADAATPLYVSDAGGRLLARTREQIGQAASYQRTFAVYNDGTQDYLLEYRRQGYAGDGSCGLTLWALDASGNLVAAERKSVSYRYLLDEESAEPQLLDVDALVAFAERANELWDGAKLLITTDRAVMEQMYWAQNEPVGPTAVALSKDERGTEVIYRETLPWVDPMLEQYGITVLGAANMELLAGLRARLNVLNERVFSPAAARQSGVSWYADLTHDGVDEIITVDTAAQQSEGTASLMVTDADGRLLYQKDCSTSHAGWATIGLYTDETGAYLLDYSPNFSQGAGEYRCTLFYLHPKNRTVEVQFHAVSFSGGMPYGAPDNDVDELVDFAGAVNTLWANTVLLVSTDEVLLNGWAGGSVGSSLYNAAGQPVTLGTDGRRTERYVAEPELSDPLHYQEQMSWTDFVLSGGAYGYPAEGSMRTRLENVNKLLADQRAELEAEQQAQSQSTDAAQPLSGEELSWFNTVFFNGADGVTAQNGFLTCAYAAPEEVDLYEVLYNGTGQQQTVTDAERTALAASQGDSALWLDVVKFTPQQADAFLSDHLGLTLVDARQTGLERFTWLEEYGTYYHCHSDTNLEPVQVTSGLRDPVGTVTLTYTLRDSGRTGCVTLQPNGEGYRFCSNRFLDSTS